MRSPSQSVGFRANVMPERNLKSALPLRLMLAGHSRAEQRRRVARRSLRLCLVPMQRASGRPSEPARAKHEELCCEHGAHAALARSAAMEKLGHPRRHSISISLHLARRLAGRRAAARTFRCSGERGEIRPVHFGSAGLSRAVPPNGTPNARRLHMAELESERVSARPSRWPAGICKAPGKLAAGQPVRCQPFARSLVPIQSKKFALRQRPS